MVTVRILEQSFAGGEISPEMTGRIDDSRVHNGLGLCRNFIVLPQGAVRNRPGFQFVREVKDSSKKTRLLSFTWSTTQTMIIELGAGYFRFHTQGATLMKDGVPYEIANPYLEKDLFEIHTVQSADVMTLTHVSYPPSELRRMGATDWGLSVISFQPPVNAPGGVNVTANTAGDLNSARYSHYQYVVTAVAPDGLSESSPSSIVAVDGNLAAIGGSNTITWSAVPGAAYYYVYKEQGGIFGTIGRTGSLSLTDYNIAPDLSKTPPNYENIFTTPGNYPGTASCFVQRRCFAGTADQPQNVWMTRSGTESSLSNSLPLRDDDRISFRGAAREANSIRHIVPLTHSLLLTSSAEWQVTSPNSDVLTPANVGVRPQSYVGASNAQPVTVNNSLIYGAARGGHARELSWSWASEGFANSDLCLRAAHLFDGYEMTEMAFARAPFPIVSCVSSSGKLLGLTYIPEQQISAWHQHVTDGNFESCAVVAEGNEDTLYCVVRRLINGRFVRMIERMTPHGIYERQRAFFVDCGLSREGDPATVFSGLDHLEGKEVSILADGAVHPRRTVTGGSITLSRPASVVRIGLPVLADLRTSPFVLQQDSAFGQGRVMNVNRVTLRIVHSASVFIGPDEKNLAENKVNIKNPWDISKVLSDEDISLVSPSKWARNGQVFVQARDPLPLTILFIMAEVSVGG